jgi:hypothetical protein
VVVKPQANAQFAPLYIRRICSLKLPVTFSSMHIQIKETALINSGAMENFINYHTVIKWRMGTKKLDIFWQVFNIDGTRNQAGSITSYCVLQVYTGWKQVLQRFYIMDLGEDQLILGYPWLCHFNPSINWAEGQLKDGTVHLDTMWFALTQKQRRNVIVQCIQEQNSLKQGDEILVITKTHSTRMGHHCQ